MDKAGKMMLLRNYAKQIESLKEEIKNIEEKMNNIRGQE